MSITKAKSAVECQEWMKRVRDAQLQRTPEAIEAARARLEQARQHKISSRKCKAVKSHAVRSRALAAEGLRQMSAASAPAEHLVVQQRWKSAQAISAQRQESAMRKSDDARHMQSESVALADDSDEEEDEAMGEVAAMIGGDALAIAALGSEGMPGAAAAPGAARSSGVIDELLSQLRKEPSNASECAAKFQLYEDYGQEVEKMRKTLLEFHEETKNTVPDSIKADMNKKIKNIDNAESMGIPDDVREWFVYHMMRQAERNNLGMASILESFEKRLEFLANDNQKECPVCLEEFEASGSRSAEVLGCCHKVCKDCWESWSTVMHGRPYCPLCRNDEFLGEITERVQ